MQATISRTAARVKSPGRAPGAERINAAYADAVNACEKAKDKALFVGFLLCEQRSAMMGSHHDDGVPWQGQTKKTADKFSLWLEANCPQISKTTAYRWMSAAQRSAAAIGWGATIEIEAQTVSVSNLLSMPESELPAGAQKYKQLWLDFVADKTIKDCLNAVIVDGEEAHRITRAHNGRTQGGSRGEDRKNFVGFTSVKLRHISTFLSHDLTSAEQGKIIASFGAAVEKWPKWILKPLAEMAAKEARVSDEERASRRNG